MKLLARIVARLSWHLGNLADWIDQDASSEETERLYSKWATKQDGSGT